MADEIEIELVRKAEQRRGRRPFDIDTFHEKQRMRIALREILNYGTVEDLKEAMREYGLSEGSPGWSKALQVWYAERGRG